jgi:hypothetical protein
VDFSMFFIVDLLVSDLFLVTEWVHGVDSVVSPISLHFHVTWASTSFGWNPVDNLIRIGYIARLAMDAIGSVDLKAIFALLAEEGASLDCS